MNLHIERKHQEAPDQTMRRLEDTNIAPTAPCGGDVSGNGVSFRLRRRSTALGLLNRGLANLYPGASEEIILKDEDEQTEFEQKLEVLMKNSHVFQKFKDRVAASGSFGNSMAARLVLEEFLQQDLLFVGKQGVIHRHSELIKHLVLTQRAPVGSNAASTSTSTSSSSSKMSLRKPTAAKNMQPSTNSMAEMAKCDSMTAESSDSSFSEDSSNSPTWSPDSPAKTVTFCGMTNVSPSLHVPSLDDKDIRADVFEGSFVN